MPVVSMSTTMLIVALIPCNCTAQSLTILQLDCSHSYIRGRAGQWRFNCGHLGPLHCPLWPRGLRRRSVAARLLKLWVRIPPGTWMFVCCECFMLSGRDLCDELITRPEESYRLWWVVVCDLETSWMRRPWPTGGCRAKNKQTKNTVSLSALMSQRGLFYFRISD